MCKDDTPVESNMPRGVLSAAMIQTFKQTENTKYRAQSPVRHHYFFHIKNHGMVTIVFCKKKLDKLFCSKIKKFKKHDCS